MAALPQHPGDGARSRGVQDVARDKLLASLSRELRFCLDGAGCLTLADGPWHAVVGIDPQALLGAHWTTIVALVDHGAMRVAIERAVALDEPQVELELRMASALDTQELVEWTLAPGAGRDAIVAVGPAARRHRGS